MTDRDRCGGDPRRLAQERAFPRIGLDQLDPDGAEDCQYEAGKSGAAAEIDEAVGGSRQQRQQLRRIEKMPPPRISERAGGDEVDAPRPLPQQRLIGREPFQRFT
jgi:hypothetical protein